MPLRGKDVDALVFADELFHVADEHLGGAVHDNPVLGTMMVHLHGQLAAGIDVQQLDLEARADVEALEEAPRAVGADVALLLTAAGLLESLDDLGDVLRAGPVSDQQCVRRVDNDQILDADGGD